METYLDHNATTPLDERVLDEMLPYLQFYHGNPSSLYRQGRLARQAIEGAREQVAQLINAQPAEIIFTSGGTEANNLAIKGAIPHLKCLAVSAIEHASVAEPARELGVELVKIGVNDEGQVSKDELQQALLMQPEFVSVMLANNETGVIQEIACLAEMSIATGALFHTDAVQAVGKVDVDFRSLGVHMMSLSAHKLYGPKGVGALVVDKQVQLVPQMLGGGQEQGHRSGTENVAAIVGFGKAAELAKNELQQRHVHMALLKQKLLRSLSQLENVTVFCQQTKSLPNTVLFAVPGIDGEALLMEMDRAGIAVSSGSACDSRKPEQSRTLVAMGIDESLARCAIRISIGKDNTEQDIDALVIGLKQQIKNLHESAMLAWA